MRDREYDDEDARRDAIDERRARFNGCKCGNPDMPGQCPGWRNCPMHGETVEDRNDHVAEPMRGILNAISPKVTK